MPKKKISVRTPSGVLIRDCPNCAREGRDPWHPESEFYAKKRDPETGEVLKFGAYCKKCSNKMSNGSHYRAVRDPVRGPAKRERDRVYQKAYERSKGMPEYRGRRQYKVKDGGYKPNTHSNKTYVPIGPFKEWYEKYLDLHNTTYRIVAEACGVHEDSLRRRLGADKIDLDFVDKILLGTGTETQLWELYDEE